MTSDPFANLSAIGRFLRHDVLPEVPAALAGELRAAIKILGAVSNELQSLHPRTERECADLQLLCRDLAATLGAPEQATTKLADNARPATGFESTVALLQFHSELSELTASLIERAQLQRADVSGSEREALDEILRLCYATLGRHAAGASRWQNVFEPASGPAQAPDEPAKSSPRR